jgi:hypothetical protein
MWANELYERERHKDMLQDAERQREILSALEKSGRKPLSKQMLAALGAKLVEVGTRLQDNVETASNAPLVTATKRA